MKNPENKPLRIVWDHDGEDIDYETWKSRGKMLAQLAVAESNLVRAGKDSALPHFISIVKELESIFGFHFEVLE